MHLPDLSFSTCSPRQQRSLERSPALPRYIRSLHPKYLRSNHWHQNTIPALEADSSTLTEPSRSTAKRWILTIKPSSAWSCLDTTAIRSRREQTGWCSTKTVHTHNVYDKTGSNSNNPKTPRIHWQLSQKTMLPRPTETASMSHRWPSWYRWIAAITKTVYTPDMLSFENSIHIRSQIEKHRSALRPNHFQMLCSRQQPPCISFIPYYPFQHLFDHLSKTNMIDHSADMMAII